ncbi:MAG TPA: peptidylprolyl isomerase [Blastocatellia bacterium]|nr:peptidylprolyl isomerase [Blastocatellia bacterium]
MSKVKEGDNVSLHYTGTLDDGTVFDSSEGKEPLNFKVGASQVIPGFENGVMGMELGEYKEIKVLPAQAYGDYYEELVKVVPRAAFPPEVTPVVGMTFEMELPTGEDMSVTIIDVEGDEVTLDANHLLAGETLNFKVRVVSINEDKLPN